MEWVEVTGKTLEEAKEAALDELGVAEPDAEVIVLTEPKTGLFGRVRGEARVRARVRPVGPRPKRNRNGRDRGGRSGGRSRSGEGSRGTSQGGSPKEDRDSGPRSEESARNGSGQGQGRSGGSRSRGGRGRGQGGGQGGGRQGTSGSERSSEERNTEMAEGMTLQEQADVAKDFLQGLLTEFGFTATVEINPIDDETVEIAAHGEGLGPLVGPKGTTLAAVQDVTRTVVQRHCPSRTDRIMVDIAGYRGKRADALRRFSEQIAAEVIESGAERALEPMSPPDRKVVHDAVNAIEGVVTRSEGQDPDRYIVVAPA